MALQALNLSDVVALVDTGRDRKPDHNPSGMTPNSAIFPDRLVLAATGTSVTGIAISDSGAEGLTNALGFTNWQNAYQRVDPSAPAPTAPPTTIQQNANPASTRFSFRGTSDVPNSTLLAGKRYPESLLQMIDAVIQETSSTSPVSSYVNTLIASIKAKLNTKLQGALQAMSDAAEIDPRWPSMVADFLTAPAINVDAQFNPVSQELTFHVELSHLFEKPLDWDLFDSGISLGEFGTIEIGGTLGATLIAPVTLKFDVGMYLGNMTQSPLNVFAKPLLQGGIVFDEHTLLTALNGGKGVPLLVGMTAPNAAPASGRLTRDAAFTLKIDQVTSSANYSMTLTMGGTGNTAAPFTNNNSLPQHLADDLNALFRQQGIDNLVRAAILVENGVSRLYLEAVSETVIGLQFFAGDATGLGFATYQSSSDLIVGSNNQSPYLSNWADMVIEVGAPSSTITGGDPGIGPYRAYVNLDGARTLGDVRDRILDATKVSASDKFTLDIQASQQRLVLERISNPAGSLPIYVLPGVGVPGVAQSATAAALGLLREPPIVVDPTNPPPLEDIGQPLHGLGYNDRIFIKTTSNTSTLAIGLGVAVDNVDVSAALGPLSFSLVGNGAPDARLLGFLVTDLKDPGTSGVDNRLYLTEEFTRPADVLDLNKFDGTAVPPRYAVEGAAHFKIIASASGILGQIVDAQLGSDTVEVPINFNFVFPGEVQFDLNLSPGSGSETFGEFLQSLDQVKVDDVLSVVRSLANYLKENPNDATKFKIPLINKSVGDVVKFADTILKAVDDFVSQVDVTAVATAVNKVRTAISNVNFSGPGSLDVRERLYAALDAIDRVLVHAEDLDLAGFKRLPARLLATVNQLAKLIEDETRDSGGAVLSALNSKLVAELDAAENELVALVPGLNAIEARLEDAVTNAINKAFNLSGINRIDFNFDYVKDYDQSSGSNEPDQPAIIVGLGYNNPNFLNASSPIPPVAEDLELSLPNGKKVTLGGATIDYHLYSGVSIDLAAGITLDDKTLFLLTKAGTTLVDVPFTNLTIDAGLSASATGKLGYKSFDLVDASVDAQLARLPRTSGTVRQSPARVTSGNLLATLNTSS